MPNSLNRDGMSERRFTVIGITDSHAPEFTARALAAISRGRVFSGGVRHHAIVEGLLPEGAVWIDVAVPLADVFEAYRQVAEEEIVVFASGDPLFYGYAATLRREFPQAAMEVIPAFNSLQTLAHRLCLPYEDMACTSLTGRPWGNLDVPLIERKRLIGVLTDRRKGPAQIAERLLRYGFEEYEMAVGENLGNDLTERVTILPPAEAAGREWQAPNCVILMAKHTRPLRMGIPEEEFEGLEGRPQMITKTPYRLMALSMLEPGLRSHMWDVGFCTGSVSIEARLRFPRLGVTAFEKRPECEGIMERNCRRFGVPGIDCVMGDFMEADLSEICRPDAVFLGGYGGRLDDVLGRIAGALRPGGAVVFNSVSRESREGFERAAAALGLTIDLTHTLTIDNHNPITAMRAVKPSDK